jgi:hypothetical protein
MQYKLLTQHAQLSRVVGVFVIIIFALLIYTWQRPVSLPTIQNPFGSSKVCTPAEWSAGRWERRQKPLSIIQEEDVYPASGFQGCASSREVGWHLSSDHPDEFPWRGNVSAYDWIPGSSCEDIPEDNVAIVKSLVEEGGWLLIGGGL